MREAGKRALIVLNGEVTATLPYVNAADYDLIVATDGAIRPLLDNGWRAHTLLGDFDSADEQVVQKAREHGAEVVHTPDQYFTDFEKALQHVETLAVTDVDIVGHTGRRLDHALGAMHAAARNANRFSIRMIDPLGIGTMVPAGKTHTLKNLAGKTCSVIGLLPSRVSLSGFKWPLVDIQIGGGLGQSISNEIVANDATVNVDDGIAFVYVILR